MYNDQVKPEYDERLANEIVGVRNNFYKATGSERNSIELTKIYFAAGPNSPKTESERQKEISDILIAITEFDGWMKSGSDEMAREWRDLKGKIIPFIQGAI